MDLAESLILREKDIQKTLVLVPDLSLQGGVANYYNTLKLDDQSEVSHFIIGSAGQQSIFKTFSRLLFGYFSFGYKVFSGNYKLIHLNPSLDKKSFFRDALFILIARMLNRRVIVFFRGWLEEYESDIKTSKLLNSIFRISYARANKYIVLSSLFKKKLIDLGVPATTPFFIETTVADSTYIGQLQLEEKVKRFDEELVFLFLSRIEKTKGIYIALDAYKLFLEKNPARRSSFIIAGDGPEINEAKNYVTSGNIPGITFTGHITGKLKYEMLAKAHILLFPSYTEGLPNTILEGMLYGQCIISRSIGGIPDVVEEGVNGFLTDSLQPSVFADIASSISNDRNIYKTIAENNYRIAKDRFTTEKVRDRILQIYRNA